MTDPTGYPAPPERFADRRQRERWYGRVFGLTQRAPKRWQRAAGGVAAAGIAADIEARIWVFFWSPVIAAAAAGWISLKQDGALRIVGLGLDVGLLALGVQRFRRTQSRVARVALVVVGFGAFCLLALVIAVIGGRA